MFLNDAFGHQANISPVYCHHEQACAMAAEAYARISGNMGLINVTTGPGGINALNGVFGAWTDSLPLLVISGQVKRETCLGSYDLPALRQLGDQEADIIAMAKPVTKYAVQINDPADIRYHLEKAIYLATSGRPGPCWLDIPIDVQSSMVTPETLLSFDPSELDLTLPDTATLNTHCKHLLDRLANAKRPVILAGTGIRLGKALKEFNTVIRQLGIPVVTAWTHDLIASDDPLFCGRAGTIGTRAGNFTVQNADLLIILGSRMNIRQTSYNWQSLAPQAFKIQVDIDPAELDKPTFRPDLAITCDGPVRSVMLFSTRPARELNGRRVIVSRSSMTSVALLELLFENVWRARPDFVPGNSELADIARFGEEEHEARLVIGDAALILNDARHGAGEGTQATYPYVYDLGSEWKAWTGLPFVFAVWVAQRTTPVAPALSAHASLIASRDWGLAHLDELAEQATRVTGVARAACVDYFQGLDYGLGYEHLAGLTEFFRRLVAAGRVPNGSLAFLPAA